MEELGCPDSPIQDDNIPHQPSIHQELIDVDLPHSSSSTMSARANGDVSFDTHEPHSTASSSDSEPPSLPEMLNLAELTPGVAAALRKMLEDNKKKELLVNQIKELMDWSTLNEYTKLLIPDDFLGSLAVWVLDHMQPEAIRTCLLEQNRKELEFYKKREDLVGEHQKELYAMKRRHQEAVAECDQKNMPHRKPLVLKKNDEEFQKKEDLIALDKKIVVAIDGLLTVQQRRFQELSIPGMKETMEPADVLRQMIVVDAIAKLAGIDTEAVA